MKYWSITFSKLPAQAMALYPLMLFKDKNLKVDQRIVQHEKIHFKQQLELLVIPFYIFYLLHYLMNLLKYRNHSKAYFEICFEKEAYRYDEQVNYLDSRKPFAWIAFLSPHC